MKYPKFIITKAGYLRMGMVHQHKDLLLEGDLCYGGGYYEFDYVANRLVLHGASYDYGRPRWKDIPALHILSSYKGLSVVYQYDDGEEYFPIADLQLDYYD